MATIKIENLSLERYGQSLLNQANLTINSGYQILLNGVSGSGKTSLAMAIAGKVPYSGIIQIYIKSARIKFIPQVYDFKDKFGLHDFYYQQRYNSYDCENSATIMDVIQMHNNLHLAEKYLDILNLTHRINAPLIQLSNGERKKIGIIEALLDEPRILLVDNPYVGLDKDSVISLNRLFGYLIKQNVQLILIAQMFEVPDFITHIATITRDKLINLTRKKNYKNEIKYLSIPDLTRYEQVSFPYTQIIEFRKVSVKYGDNLVLNNISWCVNKGDKYLLQGHNGAGKSTLISLINGDHPQSYANEIYLFGRKRGSGESIWEIKRKISFISPELHCYFDMATSCLNAVVSGFFDTTGLYTHSTDEQIRIARNWLLQFDLQKYENRSLYSVPMSIQRMILLLRALVKNSPLLIFDEPCQGLDESQSRLFIELIDKLFADAEYTIIYISHNINYIPKCINKVLHLEQGRQI